MQRFDKYWIGIVAGLIMPAVFLIVYIHTYNLWYSLQTFQLELGSVLNKLLQVSVFPDLALVFVFYTTDSYRMAKGLNIGALPYILTAVWFSL